MSLSQNFDSAKQAPQKAQPAIDDLQLWLSHYNGQQDLLNHDPIVIDEASLRVGEDWGPTPGQQLDPGSRMATPSSTDYDAGPVDGETWDRFLDHLQDREGYRNTVYADSEGHATVGVGHLVRPGDNLKIGDTISDEQVRDFLEADARTAYKAAIEQANELGINDSDFVVALGSVNYQLGTGWRTEFNNTWQHMEDGNYDQAVNNIQSSLWAQQTPVRTADFTAAIKNAGNNQNDAEQPALAGNFAAQVAGSDISPSGQDIEHAKPAESPSRATDFSSGMSI